MALPIRYSIVIPHKINENKVLNRSQKKNLKRKSDKANALLLYIV